MGVVLFVCLVWFWLALVALPAPAACKHLPELSAPPPPAAAPQGARGLCRGRAHRRGAPAPARGGALCLLPSFCPELPRAAQGLPSLQLHALPPGTLLLLFASLHLPSSPPPSMHQMLDEFGLLRSRTPRSFLGRSGRVRRLAAGCAAGLTHCLGHGRRSTPLAAAPKALSLPSLPLPCHRSAPPPLRCPPPRALPRSTRCWRGRRRPAVRPPPRPRWPAWAAWAAAGGTMLSTAQRWRR